MFLFCCSFFNCIGDKALSITHLEKSGYIEAKCEKKVFKQESEYSLVTVYESILLNGGLLIARCFDNITCVFTSYEVEKRIEIVCQKYLINQTKKILRKLESHRVFYLKQ